MYFQTKKYFKKYSLSQYQTGLKTSKIHGWWRVDQVFIKQYRFLPVYKLLCDHKR